MTSELLSIVELGLDAFPQATGLAQLVLPADQVNTFRRAMLEDSPQGWRVYAVRNDAGVFYGLLGCSPFPDGQCKLYIHPYVALGHIEQHVRMVSDLLIDAAEGYARDLGCTTVEIALSTRLAKALALHLGERGYTVGPQGSFMRHV